MIYVFGDCELDAPRCELRRAGTTVAVEPKVFKVLAHLIEHRDRVVTKDELLERFWPGAFMSESALTRCLAKARKAVDDDSVSQRIIKTVRGYGYHFVAAVAVRSNMPHAAPRPASPPATPPLPVTSTPLAAEIHTSHGVPSEERKEVTILVAGLRGAAALAQAVDVEVLYDTLQRVHALMRGEIERFEGVVTQYAGDRLIALFGAPIAHEDHATRALHAALGIQQAFAAYADELRRNGAMTLDLGVGLDVSTVVVATRPDDTFPGHSAQGLALYIAERLQASAAGGSIFVSEAVRQQVVGCFRFDDVGEVRLAEIVPPVHVYACSGAGPVTSRLEASLRRRMSMFLGREREINFLHTLWAKARLGQGQAVLLFGEAGVGKSRLAYEFQRTLTEDCRLQAQTLSYGQAMSYHAVIPLLRALLDLPDDDAPDQQYQHIRARLAGMHPTLVDDAPLLAQLLGVAFEQDQLAILPPADQKRRLQHACLQVMAQRAIAQPLCILIEDLHWLDSSSRELLDRVVASLARLPILLLGTARPGCHDTWGDYTYAHRLTVEPLSDEQTDTFVHNYLQPYDTSVTLKRLIRKYTAGNPFFMEEMLYTLLEHELMVSQDGVYVLKPHGRLEIPSSVRGALAARLDRLPPEEKRLLQTAAVIGTEVPFRLLHAIADLPEDALHRGLAHLQATEFLYQMHRLPMGAYTFKHALTHEVVYQSLLRERRLALHARALEVIESLPAEQVTDRVEQLAHHAFRGEVWEKAVVYSRQAGAKAVAQSAYSEAVAWFEQALAAVQHLPQRRDTHAQAIDLLFDLRHALVPLGEGQRILTYIRQAEALASALDDPYRLGRVSCYMAHHLWWEGENARAVVFGQRALGLATSLGDIGLQITAQFYLGRLYHALGNYSRAIDLLKRNVALLTGDLLHAYFGLAALPSVQSRTWLAWCLAELGKFAEGIACGAAGVEIAEAIDRPHDLLFAYRGLGYLHLLRGEVAQAIPVFTRGLSLCQDATLPVYFPGFAAPLGYAYTLSGQTDEAVSLLEQAVQQAVSRRTMTYRALFVTWLGEACLRAGQLDKARQLADSALQLARDQQERGHEAWALRLLGEIAAHHRPPQLDLAEVHYRQALALAGDLGMRPLLAHCQFSLGTLYGQMGRQAQAYATLSAAVKLYQAMGMTFWLPRAQAALAQMPGGPQRG